MAQNLLVSCPASLSHADKLPKRIFNFGSQQCKYVTWYDARTLPLLYSRQILIRARTAELLASPELQVRLRSVHNMTLHHMLRCVAFALTLVTTQRNARIDSDPILAVLCVASLLLIAKKSLNLEMFAFRKLTQRKALASHCEPAFSLPQTDG